MVMQAAQQRMEKAIGKIRTQYKIEQLQKENLSYQKTKLFHKNVRVEVVDVIKRNAAGKVILN